MSFYSGRLLLKPRSPDPDEASAAPVPPAQTLRRSARVNRALSGHVKRRTVEYDSDGEPLPPLIEDDSDIDEIDDLPDYPKSRTVSFSSPVVATAQRSILKTAHFEDVDSDGEECPGLVDDSDSESDDEEYSTKAKAKPVSSKGPLDVLTDLSVKLDRLHARSAAIDLSSLVKGPEDSPSLATCWDSHHNPSEEEIIEMLLRHQEAAATATQGSSDEKKRHRGLVTPTSDKPAAIPPPTDRLNRTQRKRIAREAQKVKAALAQSTKPTKVSSASSAIVPPVRSTTSGRAAQTVPAPTTATEGQRSTKKSNEPDFWRSTNVKVREAEHAFVSGTNYANAYEAVVKETLDTQDLQGQTDALPD